MKIGDKLVPDNRLPNMIEAVRTLYGQRGFEEIDDGTTATLLGHSTPKSGSFIQKRADLRSFGLIEPRGTVKVNDLGRKISYPESLQEEQEGLIQAITNIELWKLIYEKYTAKGETLPSVFWTDIRVWTGIPPEEAKNASETLKKAYLEDIKYIRPVNELKKREDELTDDKNDTFNAIGEGVIGRVILSGSGHIDVKDEATYMLAEAYLKVFADKLGIKKKKAGESN